VGYQPFNYVAIEKVDPRQFSKYDAPRARTPMPLVWAQVRNELYIAPPPLISTKVRFLATPDLVPLAKVEGVIMEFSGNILTLDRAPTATLSTYLNALGMNFISICDGTTGEVKACYTYEGINGVEITLGSGSPRTSVKGQEVRKCYEHSGFKLEYTALTKSISATVNSQIVSVSVGDYVEISDVAVAGTRYNIEEVRETDADFYDPPEYEAPAVSFTRGGLVTAVSANSITWSEPTATPPFTNGYPTEATVFSGALDGTLTDSTYNSYPVKRVTMSVAHGLTVGKVYKVTIANTDVAAINGLKKIIPDTATSFVILVSSSVGVFNPATATWALYQYPVQYVETGWPALRDVSPSYPPLATASITVNTPYIYSLKPDRSNNDPDIYDHMNDIAMDDVVCWGYGTGIPIIPEAYHESLVQYAVLTVKSSMNETDNEVAALLKELFTSMKGDTAGRRIGAKIQRTFGTRSNYLTQSRRIGRR
jgi:hypothetical protein